MPQPDGRRILVAVLSPATRALGAAQIALNLADGLQRLGANASVWSPYPLPPSLHWSRRYDHMAQALRDHAAANGPFDVIDAPPVVVSAALRRHARLVVARSVQPDLGYLWAESRHPSASLPLHKRAAAALNTLHLALRVLRGWHHAGRILCLGTRERAAMERWFPGWRGKLAAYTSAPSDEDRRMLRGLRARREPPAGAGRRFLWLGRWSSQKGVRTLQEVIRRRLAESADERFCIAGCGDDAAIDPALLASGRVRVVPSYSRAELESLLAAHDAGLFTSTIEGWGLSVQEMLESGMTVYATREGAVPDIAPYFPEALRPLEEVHAAGRPVGIPKPPPDEYLARFCWPAIASEYLRCTAPAQRS